MNAPAALEQLACRQILDESTVRSEEVVTGQVAQLTPAQIVEDVVGHFAFILMNGEELQIDRTAVAIGMPHMSHRRANHRFDPQFLFKLADQGLFRAFSRLHFASGKFPLEGHGLIGTALADQYLVAAEDESGDDIAHGFEFRGARFMRFGIPHAHTSLDGSCLKIDAPYLGTVQVAEDFGVND